MSSSDRKSASLSTPRWLAVLSGLAAIALAVVVAAGVLLAVGTPARAAVPDGASELAAVAEAAQPRAVQATYTVCPAGPTTCDYATIQDAVDAASEGDLIKVATGTYTDIYVRPRQDITTTGTVTQVLYLNKSVIIEGGYTTSNWDDMNPEANPTTLDAGGQGRGIYITGAHPEVMGLRITGGDASGMGGESHSGGDAGGGIYVYGGALLRENVAFGNIAEQGGGLFLEASNATVAGNTFTGNYGESGGGIGSNNCADEGNLHLLENEISGNSSGMHGGGGLSMSFCCDDEKVPVVEQNTISGNNAQVGGGLMLFVCPAVLERNTITLNTASASGGGIFAMNRGDGRFYSTVIADNDAGERGSAVFVEGSSPSFLYTTLHSNSGGDGSGIYVDTWDWEDLSSSLLMVHTIIDHHDLGIYVDGGNEARLDGVLWYHNTVTGTHSVTGTLDVTNQLHGDPAYVAPGSDYHIGATSAARDAGPFDNIWTYWDSNTDIDGESHRMGWSFDLGADEYPDASFGAEMWPSSPLVQAGGSLAYTLLFTNTGLEDATSTTVTTTMDAWQQATNATATQGSCTITDAALGGEVVCTPGTLVPGAEVTVTIEAEVSSGAPAAQAMSTIAFIWSNETAWGVGASTVTFGELAYPLDSDPWTLDPALANDAPSTMVLNQIMEGLYRVGADGSMEPAGALTHTFSADATVLTVTLRSDAVWSDGSPVIAQHYADGMLRVLDPATGSDQAWRLSLIVNADEYNNGSITDPNLVGIEVLDPNMIKFTLREPAVYFPSILATTVGLPVRLDLIDSDPDWTQPGHFVGNGPYLLASWVNGSYLTLEPNSLYYDAGEVTFGQIALPIMTPEEQLAAYEAGLVDVSQVPGEELARIQDDPQLDAEFHSTNARGVDYIGLNTQLGATDELGVRKALASAVDRTHIVSDVQGMPWSQPATSVIAPGLLGYQNGLVGYPYNPTQAQTYLADAGYPDGAGFPGLELWANQGRASWVEVLAEGWRQTLNISVTTVYTDGTHFLDMLNACREDPGACTYNAYRLGWLVDYADPHNVLGDLFHPDSGGQFTGWDDALYREVMELSQMEGDPTARTGYLQEADQILVEEQVAIIPIHYYENAALIKGGIAYEYPVNQQPYLMKWGIVEVPGPVLAVVPPETETYLGQTFEVAVQVQAGEQEVDAAAGHLDFDPAALQVVDLTPGTALDLVLQNEYDNGLGEISFAAGTLTSPFPMGTFTLYTVTLEAIAGTPSTDLAFHLEAPRLSDITFGGESVLGHTENGTVTIGIDAVLDGSVLLQGRPAQPDPSWSVPLSVALYESGETVPAYEFSTTTDEYGTFELGGIVPGSYTALIKNPHTLQNKIDVVLGVGPNELSLGELREGDANDDNCVLITDFSILATTFGEGEGDAGFDERADFNEDSWVSLLDFSLLATNFGECGDDLTSEQPEEQASQATTDDLSTQQGEVQAPLVTAADVEIVVDPPMNRVKPGETFTVTVQVQAGSQLVDGAQASLDFDPEYVQVLAMTGHTDLLPFTLMDEYDNVAGTLDYAGGALSGFPDGTFDLVTVQFEAITETVGTALAFHFEQPRLTDVSYGGRSVLTGHVDGEVVIAEQYAIYLPLVLR